MPDTITDCIDDLDICLAEMLGKHLCDPVGDDLGRLQQMVRALIARDVERQTKGRAELVVSPPVAWTPEYIAKVQAAWDQMTATDRAIGRLRPAAHFIPDIGLVGSPGDKFIGRHGWLANTAVADDPMWCHAGRVEWPLELLTRLDLPDTVKIDRIALDPGGIKRGCVTLWLYGDPALPLVEEGAEVPAVNVTVHITPGRGGMGGRGAATRTFIFEVAEPPK